MIDLLDVIAGASASLPGKAGTIVTLAIVGLCVLVVLILIVFFGVRFVA